VTGALLAWYIFGRNHLTPYTLKSQLKFPPPRCPFQLTEKPKDSLGGALYLFPAPHLGTYLRPTSNPWNLLGTHFGLSFRLLAICHLFLPYPVFKGVQTDF